MYIVYFILSILQFSIFNCRSSLKIIRKGFIYELKLIINQFMNFTNISSFIISFFFIIIIIIIILTKYSHKEERGIKSYTKNYTTVKFFFRCRFPYNRGTKFLYRKLVIRNSRI